MLVKATPEDIFEGIDIKLGQAVKYNGNKEFKIRPFNTKIIGIDIDSFRVGVNLVMIEYEKSKYKISETKFDNLDIIYLEDKPFIWASLDELDIIHEKENTPI